MKIRPYVEKLNSSAEFKKFKEKYGDSFLVAGFFILDLEMGKNLHQIDFYIPSEKKIAAFSLDKGIKVQILDMLNDLKPEKLDIKTNIDLDAIPGILEDEMKNRNITEDIRKIIAVIQNIKGKKIWNLNCVLSGMEILKAHVEDESKTVLKMEKVSMMEIMKRIPAGELAKLQPKDKGAPGMNQPGSQSIQIQPADQAEEPEQSEEEERQELEKLEELESEIEKEKKRLKKNLSKSSKTSKASKTKAKKKKSESKSKKKSKDKKH